VLPTLPETADDFLRTEFRRVKHKDVLEAIVGGDLGDGNRDGQDEGEREYVAAGFFEQLAR
jgi:hypothetical protein